MKTTEKVDWSYLAGIVDGEGSIVIYPHKDRKVFTAEIVIPNTSLVLMKWLVSNFGGKFNVFQPKNLHGYNRKLLYRWRASGKKNRENILLGIIPYLVIKKEQAKVLLEFLRLGYGETEKRIEFAKKCSLLNHGDESVTTNMFNVDSTEVDSIKIESELIGDNESAHRVICGEENVSSLA
jgi:hypothetical protein